MFISIRPLLRGGLLASTILVLLAAGFAPARAQDGDPTPRCVCVHREACDHFLNAPVAYPDDPCPCAACEAGPTHVPGPIPKGFDAVCMASNRLACFLKRHARSWKFTCSACLEEHKCCPQPHQDTCPECGPGTHDDPFAKDELRQDARATTKAQLALERRFFDKKKVIVAYTRHFYLVTDIPKMRLQPEGGTVPPRWATGHEYAHLMLQRAEQTYDEVSKALGGSIKLLRPMGIYLPKLEQNGRALQDVYFRNARNHMIYSSYAGRTESAISDRFCLNGFCVPLERVKKSAAAARSRTGDDYALHGSMRHLITHVLSTC